MKPPPFDYYDPDTVAAAVELLVSLDNAKILAGGQTLMPMLNMRYAMPDHIVDLARIEGLSYIREEDGGLVIGAMTRQRDIEYSSEVKRQCPLMAEAILFVGHRQTRNRGTIGGSLCHMDAAAELPLVCALHDVVIKVQGAQGTRDIEFKNFPSGYLGTSLQSDEVLISVYVPDWGAGHGFGFEEFARRHGDFAIVSAAALLQTGSNGKISKASLALGGVGPAPLRLPEAEEILVGNSLTEDVLSEVGKVARKIEPLDDVHAPARYRQQLAEVLSKRALKKAWSRTQGGAGGAVS